MPFFFFVQAVFRGGTAGRVQAVSAGPTEGAGAALRGQPARHPVAELDRHVGQSSETAGNPVLFGGERETLFFRPISGQRSCRIWARAF